MRFAPTLVLLAGFVAGCATQQPTAAPAHPAPRRLTVIGINDTHGGLLPQPASKPLAPHTTQDVGGADWFAGYVNAARAAARDRGGAVVVLDAGDVFQGTLISNEFRGKSVVDVYDAIGLTAEAIGNHDFDFGIPVLLERMRDSKFPWVSCNVYLRGTRNRPDWAKPSVLVDVDGLRVGIVGASTRETATVTNPVNVRELEFPDAAPCVAEEADKLRQQGATVVLLTAHAGPLAPDHEIQHLAEAAKGKVDAIVSGHHHTQIGVKPGEGPLVVAGIPIIQSGWKLQAFSTIDLALDGNGHVTGFEVNADSFPKPGAPQPLFHDYNGAKVSWRGQPIAPDPQVTQILATYDGKVKQIRDQVIGQTTVALVKAVGPNEDLLGNLTSDAMRSGLASGLKADIGVQNSGGLRISHIDAGPITFGQIFDLYPFDNEQVVLTLTAPQVRAAIEALPRQAKNPLRVSGVHYVVDWDKFGAASMAHPPDGAIVVKMTDDAGKVLCETRSCTQTACDSVCAPGTWSVALTDFLANGGDGVPIFKDAPRKSSGAFARDMVVAYVKDHRPLTPQVLGAESSGAPPRIIQHGKNPKSQ